jgi:hypothetical protein
MSQLGFLRVILEPPFGRLTGLFNTSGKRQVRSVRSRVARCMFDARLARRGARP